MADEERKDEELERKLRAYFQTEEGKAPPPGDLWERLSPQLGEQEPPRWGFRLPTFGMSGLPIAHGAVAAVLVLLIAGGVTWGIVSNGGGGVIAPQSVSTPVPTRAPAGPVAPAPVATVAPAPTVVPGTYALSDPAVAGATPTPAPATAPEAVGPPGLPAPTAGPAEVYGTPSPLPALAPMPTGTPPPYAPLPSPTPTPHPPYGDEAPPVKETPYALTFFQNYGVNPFVDTVYDHLSTFAMDVDTASYTVARRFIMDGNLPNPDSVRVEEFINFFEQEYQPPAEDALAIHLEAAPSPFGEPNHWLMRVGLQGREVPAEKREDASLVFVIDVSGSMARENRMELVKKALRLLVEELRPYDQVGIVTYNISARVVLRPTRGWDKDAILRAIDMLRPGGSTNAEAGLKLGYDMAREELSPLAPRRIILLSDGVANVGNVSAETILREERSYVEDGITLSAVGMGMGNSNDVLLEQLADNGDGTYAYVDRLGEARRIFVENLTGTLQTIARDAKVQVYFNPEVVRRYRLLGYENREVADQDFRNDYVDAGEVGAGHSVTALYELELYPGAQGRADKVYVRYEEPDTGKVREASGNLFRSQFEGAFEKASPRFQLDAAVAEYAEILRGSYWARYGSLEEVRIMAQRVGVLLQDDPDVIEFAYLVTQAEQIAGRMPIPERE